MTTTTTATATKALGHLQSHWGNLQARSLEVRISRSLLWRQTKKRGKSSSFLLKTLSLIFKLKSFF